MKIIASLVFFIIGVYFLSRAVAVYVPFPLEKRSTPTFIGKDVITYGKDGLLSFDEECECFVIYYPEKNETYKYYMNVVYKK